MASIFSREENGLDAEVEALYQAIMGRQPFSYRAADDPLYRSYADRYVQNGRLAMRDTMGSAAALTGGYGSSYAQGVGQQRYDEYLRQLSEAVPELYGMAFQRYQAEGEALRDAYDDNQRAGLTWWEDAVAEAYLLARLGFSAPDKHIYHLLVDEAQDYSETALAMLAAYYPNARVTLLGDPKQRTCPGMEPCRPENWGECFGMPDAPLFTLSKCYRSATPIAELCNHILPENPLQPFGRGGDQPLVAQYSEALLRETLDRFRAQGHRSIAVITRSKAQADSLSTKLENVYRLDGGEADLHYEATDNVVACYHLTKGLEFDAVIVVWPDVEFTDGERRRLYTACSRALHSLALLAGGGTLKRLGL